MLFETDEGITTQNLMDTTHRESQEIIALAHIGGDSRSREERIRRNALLREKLASSSDTAVAWAATNVSGLVEQELLARIEQGHTIPLDPLFEIMNRIAAADPKGGVTISRGDKRTLQFISQYVLTQSGYISEDEMVKLIGRYIGSPIWGEYWKEEAARRLEETKLWIAQQKSTIPPR